MKQSEKDFSYQALLSALKQSQEFGFLSPQPVENQIAHSMEFISFVPTGYSNILDLGVGGGLPTLVWLHISNDVRITALDAMRKRTDFLESARKENSSLIDRLEVINGRAEELGRKDQYREKFDLIVARGFGAPGVTAECASPLLSVGGLLIVSGRPENEIERWDVTELKVLGLKILEVKDGEYSHAIIIKKIDSTPDEFPRRASAIKKTPLWV